MKITKSKIHFIGIGGIGVSALARYYLARGHEVSGCDLSSSEITDALLKLGAKIRIGPSASPCVSPPLDQIIYSPAIPSTHPDIQKARQIPNAKYQIHVLSYPQALGELTKTHYTIAISGTHGKSTTTAMIGLLLVKAGLDPTVVVGTKLKEFGNSNCRVGKGKYLIKGKQILVIEADEHFASFLNYWPEIIVLTTIEEDHLDYYKNLNNILRAFRKYISHLSDEGILVANGDDKNIKTILKSRFKTPALVNVSAGRQNSKIQFKAQKYSLRQKEAEKLRKILKIPGEHNVSNALAALATARVLGVSDKVSYKALSEYKGSWRRFEIFRLKTPVPYTLVSDYGHHPTKIRVTVEAARSKWPKKEIWLVYQPHQYARTYYLFEDFVKVLSNLSIEKLILTDIFDVAGREETKMRKQISSLKLFEEIRKVKRHGLKALYIPSASPFEEIEEYLAKNLRGGEVVMIMGAGDIYNLTVRLTKES